jgi:REP-associated tyrosine transposase
VPSLYVAAARPPPRITTLTFPRVVVPGCPHHVLHRGNRKEKVFFDDSDRLVYLRLMREACKKYQTLIWTYVLMNNHVHYVAVPECEDSLHKTIKVAHGDYTSYFNSKYGLVGHAWQGRFKSFPMDEAYCRNAVRYIERNPVRAGMVARAEDYSWSSAAAHCGLRDDLLLSGTCPLVFEIPNWSEWLKIDPGDAENEIIRRHSRTGRPLGTRDFLVRIGNQIGRDLLPRKRGPRPNNTHPGDRETDNPEPAHPLFR